MKSSPGEHLVKLPWRRGGRSCARAALALAIWTTVGAAGAAGWSATSPEASDDSKFAIARKQIAAKQWAQAIQELKKIDAVADADWNNLMGYAMRMQTPPDLDASQRYYDAALRIDPNHKGTLEYAGELALMKGDLETAEARRARLTTVCKAPCEELDELTQAIAAYRANGNRWKP